MKPHYANVSFNANNQGVMVEVMLHLANEANAWHSRPVQIFVSVYTEDMVDINAHTSSGSHCAAPMW